MKISTFSEKRKFIIKLGKSLHKYGTPSDRLESHLSNVSTLLGIQAFFMVAPTGINFIFHNEQGEQDENHIARVSPGEIDLGALARTDAIVDRLVNNSLTLIEANQRLDEIAARPNSYHPLVTLVAFAGGGGAFAMISQGSWHDVAWAALISMVVFGLVSIAERSKRVAYMLEPLAAITAAFIASACSHIDHSINVPLVILSSIIMFIPGLALLQGLSELSAKQMVSGSVRVMDALMQMFKLYFGSLLGITFATLAFGEAQFQVGVSVESWALWLAVSVLSITLTVAFKARIKDLPWILASSNLAYAASLLGASYISITMGAFIGAFSVGVFSNLYARFIKSPALITSLPGLVVLVPGSKLFILLNSVMSGQAQLANDQLGQQAFLVFMSLVAGVIFANVAIAPKRSL